MAKARRRNLRAPASASPSPITTRSQQQQQRRRPATSRNGSVDIDKAIAVAKTPFDGVYLDSDAEADSVEQLDLKSFIDMTSHSSNFAPLVSAAASSATHRSRDASRCCVPTDPASPLAEYALDQLSQEQQSSAPLPARNVVNFLRNKSGMKTRVGALNGKRVDYFKGSAAVKALLSPVYAKLKDVPKVTTKEEAEEALHNIIPYAFFLRVDRGASTGGKDSPKVVEINQQQMFKSDQYYVWLYEGSQLGLKLAGLGMVGVMLAGVMFHLWPPTMRLGVWYLSVAALGLMGFFFVLAIIRLIFWLITVVVAKPGIWIFPNLFEDVGFVDSFIPLWAWDVPPPPKKKSKSDSSGAAGAREKKKASASAASGVRAGARQQALSGLGGAGPTAPPSPPKVPQQAAQSTPAKTHAAQSNGSSSSQGIGSGGPGAGHSLDDIN